jgi:NAD(P)-dependent dehydrogenase (short-subunit alcohol dehydrogenase family)
MILKDQVAIVTGAGTGIGRASALAYAEAGAHVVCADINPKTAEDTANTIMAGQRRALPLAIDVGNLEDIDRMVRRTIEEFGKVDILLANAGVTRRAHIMDLTEADWDRIHRVNAKGVFFCLQRVAREMIPRRSGRIINIASIAGKGYAGTSNAAYAASKGAVISLTRTAAQQLGPHNINVNAICPGVTRTALSEANLAIRAQEAGLSKEDFDAQRQKEIPIQRANDPEDIAAMAVFLATPGARNITGQTYNVDGGIIPE